MSQVLTVPTHFNDIGELSEGFLDRVERDTLILYGPVAYEDGSEIEFAVLLADGSTALEGTGRVRAAVDGGADRVPETRYDVVVEALKLDGRYDVVFERLVLARQAVSDAPPSEEDKPSTTDIDDDDNAVVDQAEPLVDDADSDQVLSLAPDEVFSVAPDEVYSVAPEEVEPGVVLEPSVPPEESAPDTAPPGATDEDDDEYDDEPATIIAAVDAAAIMADAAAAPETTETDTEEAGESNEHDQDHEYDEVVVNADRGDVFDLDEGPALELPADAQAVLEAGANTTGEQGLDDEVMGEGGRGFDSEYAFEHGIATEPQVGMPVPIPSMAAPPDAPPAPPTLRLAEPPEGLTRPSLEQVEEAVFSTDGEVSDVHTTGLFAYEDGLPIPSRPPLPDPNGSRPVVEVEAAASYDVEESEPPEANDDEYEEVRLSDFAEAAEEG